MKSLFKRYTPLQIAMHIYAWSTLVILIFDFFTHNLTANPIQARDRTSSVMACRPVRCSNAWIGLAVRLCVKKSKIRITSADQA